VNIEAEIRKIQERNKKVEMDKAWETSLARKILVAIGTYFVMVLVMAAMDIANPLTGAIIPTLGFLLSTLSIDFVKSIWMRRRGAVGQ